MHLINTTDLILHEFQGDQIPQYGILSHRWEDGEVSMKELRRRRNTEKAGWRKIEECCRVARNWEPSLDFIWVDTCCINKESSAELSEVINAMYHWYKNATVCFTYLSDVAHHDDYSGGEQHRARWEASFKESKWFGRGWTLQELLAPTHTIFFSKNWEQLGTRLNFNELITEATGIPGYHLSYFNPRLVGTGSRGSTFAEVASWAAHRTTTRPEDMAYSLLGILNINMPLLYGEGGAKAFVRLQLEYLNRVDDETVFCWDFPSDNSAWRGLLSVSPKHFQNSGAYKIHTWDEERPPYQMTNKGLRIEPLLLLATGQGFSTNNFIMPLNCSWQGRSPQPCAAIRVVVLGGPNGRNAIRRRKELQIEQFDSAQLGSDTTLVRRELYFQQEWECLS